MTTDGPKRDELIIEQVGGEFGASVRYQVNGASITFFAAEITMMDSDGSPCYWRKGAADAMSDPAKTLDDAERYIEGYVKWDGCSEVSFGDEGGQLHLCGKSDFNKLASILGSIYGRCGTLMREQGTQLLEGEFNG